MNTFIDPMEWFDAGTASTTPEAKDSATKESLVEPMVFGIGQHQL